MSFPKQSSTKWPWIGSLVLVSLLWTLWSLELNSVRLVTDENLTGAPSQSAVDYIEPIVDAATNGKILPPDFGKPYSHEANPNDQLGPDETILSLDPAVSERPLILYAYSDGKTYEELLNARANFEFFIAHGLHAAADFVFIFNGNTTAVELVPQASNIRVVQRENDCYDMGAYAEVLTTDNFYLGYKKFIMLNASIRGPFVPYWAKSCWSDLYLSKITDEVKLVGMTGNCWPTFHIQSMIWATDIIGLKTLLFPPEAAVAQLSKEPLLVPSDLDDKLIPAPFPGINSCFHNWGSAVAAEVGSSAIMTAAGFKLDAMMSAYHGNPRYAEDCNSEENGDVLFDKKYFGTNVDPFETVFIKSNRDIDPVRLARLTEWTKGRQYSSYDFCPTTA